MSYPFILTPGSSLSIMINGKNYILDKSHANFASVVEAIKSKAWDSILGLIDIPKMINTFGQGKVTVMDGEVFYNKTPIHNSLTTRILGMFNDGFDIKPFVSFMENLMQNPSKNAVNELYDFLERCSLPITEDGHFLAYKKVRKDWKDFYTGKFDHAIGTTLEMERNQVDDTRTNTCSTGFHFCSFSYLPHYASNTDYRVIVVKINPKDVVSIPTDYNFAKGRACKYVVVDESFDGIHKEKFDKSCYSYPFAEMIDKIDLESEVDGPADDTIVVDLTAYGNKQSITMPAAAWPFPSATAPTTRKAITKADFIALKASMAPTPKKTPKRDSNGRFLPKHLW